MSLKARPPRFTHPLVASGETIDSVVRELNDLHQAATLDFALRVGRIVIDRLYGGDVGVWRRQRSTDASFRKLAARSRRGLVLSASTLYRAVALCELCDRIAVSIRGNLGAAHLRAVLG